MSSPRYTDVFLNNFFLSLFALDYSKKKNSNEQTSSRQHNDRQFQGQLEQTQPPPLLSSRQISDEVFIVPDTPVSNEEDNQQEINNQEDGSAMIRQRSRRNWADYPIDETVVDTPPTPPSTTNNTSTRNDIEDFQVRK